MIVCSCLDAEVSPKRDHGDKDQEEYYEELLVADKKPKWP